MHAVSLSLLTLFAIVPSAAFPFPPKWSCMQNEDADRYIDKWNRVQSDNIDLMSGGEES